MKIYRILDNETGDIFSGIISDKFYPFEKDVYELFCENRLSMKFISEKGIPLERIKILPPSMPTKIVAIGLNYKAHAKEMNKELPDEPLIFLKPSSAVTGHGDYIILPECSERVDYEGELALVIGDRCINCTPEQAQGKIWGYTIANDVTARDLQRKDGQWTRAKGFDTFCPLGPWVVREISPAARLQTFLNEETKPVQSALINQMVFSPEVLVAYISQVMTLMPGDVVLTGTPEGVGPMQVGDRVRVEIEGIGYLNNTVVAREINQEA